MVALAAGGGGPARCGGQPFVGELAQMPAGAVARMPAPDETAAYRTSLLALRSSEHAGPHAEPQHRHARTERDEPARKLTAAHVLAPAFVPETANFLTAETISRS
jgi:hypothetical protein